MSDLGRAMAIAGKIAAINNAIAGLEREMVIMKCPADFQKIMLEAVAKTATLRAAKCGQGSGA
jgi:hypothetical protein